MKKILISKKNNESIQQKPDHNNRFFAGIKRLIIRPSGFTLLELLTVVTIIGILASIATMSYLRQVRRAKIISAINEINTLIKEVRIYQINGPLPNNLADLGYPDFLDPWGHPYQYAAPPIRTRDDNPINTEFDVYSRGKDGMSVPDIDEPESQDDIIRAGNDYYVGPAAKY